MKIHTTNYINTFIAIADDCPSDNGEMPPLKGESKTIANMQFEMISKNPYKFTSDDVLFEIFAIKNDITKAEYKTAREKFFSKGQACFRASPLTKRYAWGVHHNSEGKIAIVGAETEAYQKFMENKDLKIVKAMKSAR
jgi:hypothetical protein